MNLFGVLQIGASALAAERLRAEVVASNMANIETTRTPEGGPYRRRLTVFRAEQPGGFPFQLASLTQKSEGSVPGGVRIERVVTDTAPPLKRYQPGHPDADSAGYVAYQNAYQAAARVITTISDLTLAAVNLGKD
jgi:flagellar basal-body rod protein FlgC